MEVELDTNSQGAIFYDVFAPEVEKVLDAFEKDPQCNSKAKITEIAARILYRKGDATRTTTISKKANMVYSREKAMTGLKLIAEDISEEDRESAKENLMPHSRCIYITVALYNQELALHIPRIITLIRQTLNLELPKTQIESEGNAKCSV